MLAPKCKPIDMQDLVKVSKAAYVTLLPLDGGKILSVKE